MNSKKINIHFHIYTHTSKTHITKKNSHDVSIPPPSPPFRTMLFVLFGVAYYLKLCSVIILSLNRQNIPSEICYIVQRSYYP